MHLPTWMKLNTNNYKITGTYIGRQKKRRALV
nr:MAG TPA: hypothetical protein [Caudoviricetes sp.]